VAAMIEQFERGRIQEAIRWHERLLPLVKAMFIETNPIPVKTAMGILGVIDPELRLPLCAMEGANLEKLRAALEAYGLHRQSLRAVGSGLRAKRRPRAPSPEPRA